MFATNKSLCESRPQAEKGQDAGGPRQSSHRGRPVGLQHQRGHASHRQAAAHQRAVQNLAGGQGSFPNGTCKLLTQPPTMVRKMEAQSKYVHIAYCTLFCTFGTDVYAQ